jgi:glutamine amidotransferase
MPGMKDHSVLIPDFGVGNLPSIIRMVEKVGGCCSVSRHPEELLRADKIIFAGVGAFDHGMKALETGGWREALETAALGRKVPLIGICLGMQILCKTSEEGQRPGLGWIDADVLRFRQDPAKGLRIPHMGWNTLKIYRDNPLIPPTGEEQRFYFVHSYRVVCYQREDVIAVADYGGEFVAAFQRENIFGVQFHPEKSHRFGMMLLKRFLEL